jgi:hypothetical protein
MNKNEILFAITLTNPWPYCVTDLGKRVENRSWWPAATLIGQRIALHAGKTIEPESWSSAATLKPELRKMSMSSIPYGAIVGMFTLAGYVRADRGVVTHRAGRASKTYEPASDPWFFGPVGWLLADVVKFQAPIECRGSQRLWTVPPSLAKQCRAQDEQCRAVAA